MRNLDHGGCLDEHHQDQLLILMALANGTSQIRVGKELTEHTESVFYILKYFIPNLQIKVEDAKEGDLEFKIIEIVGIN